MTSILEFYQDDALRFAVYPTDAGRHYLFPSLVLEVYELSQEIAKNIWTEEALSEIGDVQWNVAGIIGLYGGRYESYVEIARMRQPETRIVPSVHVSKMLADSMALLDLHTKKYVRGDAIPDHIAVAKVSKGLIDIIYESLSVVRAFNTSLESVLEQNLVKLTNRAVRNQIKSDNRTAPE